ncbi:hypothetical protein ACJJTC_004423 [Scirpophaga incertulas]
MSSSSEVIEESTPPVEVVYQASVTSSMFSVIEQPSLLKIDAPEAPKMILYKKGLYDPGSGEICAKYIAMSDSEVLRHVYYAYPGIKDPGIVDALFETEISRSFGNNGQELYLELCDQMGMCPVRSFYRGLVERDINLRYYCVNPAGVRAMCRALLYNTSVKRLDLSFNYLSLDACYHLGRLMAENVVLTELILTGCKLALRSNSLGAEAAQSLTTALEVNNTITHLDLSWNLLFSPEASNELIRMLARSEVLVELNMSWNGLTSLPALERLLKVPTLTYLNLSNNRLTSISVRALCNGMKKFEGLQTLDLSYNPLLEADSRRIVLALTQRNVTVNTVLMEGVVVDRKFAQTLKEVLLMKHRKNTTVTYGKVLHDYVIKNQDLRHIIMRRLLFISSTKKSTFDVAVYFLTAAKTREAIQPREVMRVMKVSGVVPDEQLLEELSNVFPGPKTDKGGKTIALRKVVEFIHRLWPDKKAIETPPPEVEITVTEKKNKKRKNLK